MKTLTHITDVGAPSHEGCDSTKRIKDQYQRLNFEAQVITAGKSPLEIAFLACTQAHPQAKINARKALAKLGLTPQPLAPVALNSAPRNSDQILANGKEDHIFRVTAENEEDAETLLIYGPEVLKWILAFRGKTGVAIERIIEIPDIIADTSIDSQFRSCEHLPIVHAFQARGKLDENSRRENIDVDSIPDFSLGENEVLVLSPDEYSNGRVLVQQNLFDEIFSHEEVKIPAISDNTALQVRRSLTEVTPFGVSKALSVWPSSNHLPQTHLNVLNIGTRWEKGATSPSNDPALISFVQQLRNDIGKCYRVG